MTQHHPIALPPDLAAKWVAEIYGEALPKAVNDPVVPLHPITLRLVERAAQWGYEQHEKMLLDAMHSLVPQPYEQDDE